MFAQTPAKHVPTFAQGQSVEKPTSHCRDVESLSFERLDDMGHQPVYFGVGPALPFRRSTHAIDVPGGGDDCGEVPATRRSMDLLWDHLQTWFGFGDAARASPTHAERSS